MGGAPSATTPAGLTTGRAARRCIVRPGPARARIAAQASDEQRRSVADVVLDNSGTLEQLADQVDRFWTERVAPHLVS